MINLTSDKIRTDVVRRDFFNEDDSFFNKLNITRKSYNSPLGLHMYLIELSDGYYYAKKKDEVKICNEIVGRYLCNKLGLETTSLDLLLDRDKLKMVTPNYRKEELKYQYQKDDADKLFKHQYDIERLKILPKDFTNIDRFLNVFEESYRYFLEVFDVEVDELISYIENNYPIEVPDKIKEIYDKTISKNQKILKSIR